ncbi:protein of unknown function [Magnetospira sp. QH-2]|nr:protein of unknown function [Magnetospira sp. QH-2]
MMDMAMEHDHVCACSARLQASTKALFSGEVEKALGYMDTVRACILKHECAHAAELDMTMERMEETFHLHD